jgi:hypothetical protein
VGNNPVNFSDPTGLFAAEAQMLVGKVGATREGQFALGFVPGYDLYSAYQNPHASMLDYGIGVLGIIPGMGKGAGLVLRKADDLVGAAARGGARYSDDLVRAAQRQFPGKAGKIEQHHITPEYIGGARNGPKVPLDAAYHQQITNEFRRLHPYGSEVPSPARVQEIMRQVYEKYPLPPGY